MFYFIIGGSKVGKSRYAELLCSKINSGRKIYLATMIPVGEGEEGTACIERHRAQRQGLNFITYEMPLEILSWDYEKDDTVLLEDISNLVANHLFDKEGCGNLHKVIKDVLKLNLKCENLVAVSFYGLEESKDYDDETNGYIKKLSVVNEELIKRADVVVLMEEQKPYSIKGKLPNIFI